MFKFKQDQKNHRRIHLAYFELKEEIYFPNLKLEVHKYINNCIVCNMCKYDS